MKIYQLIDDKYGIRSAGGMSVFSIDDRHYSLTCAGDGKVIIHPLIDGFKASITLAIKHSHDQKIMRFHKECIRLTPAQLMGFEPGDYLTHKSARETFFFKEDNGNYFVEVVSLEGRRETLPVTVFTKHQTVKHKHSKQMLAYATDKNLVAICERNRPAGWISFLNPTWDEDVKYFLCLEKHRGTLLHALNEKGPIQYLVPESGRWITVEGEYKYNPVYNPVAWYMRDDCQSRIKPKKEKRWIGVFRNDNGFMENTDTSYESIEELKESVYAPNGFDAWQFIQIEFEV